MQPRSRSGRSSSGGASHWARTLEYGALLSEEKRAEFSEPLRLRALPHRANSGGADPAPNGALELRLGLQDRCAGDNMRWAVAYRLSRWATDLERRNLADRAVATTRAGSGVSRACYAPVNRSMLAMLAGKNRGSSGAWNPGAELASVSATGKSCRTPSTISAPPKTGASDESGWADLESSLAFCHGAQSYRAGSACIYQYCIRRVNARDHARAAPIFDQGIAFC